MILYHLLCAREHGFEAWFRDSAAYDHQAARGLIACPHCASRQVRKAIMAPRLARAGRKDSEPPPENGLPRSQPASSASPASGAAEKNLLAAGALDGELREALRHLRRKVEESCEYVGPRFAEEVRRMQDGRASRRQIYGEASEKETQALEEEGIEVTRIPWIEREDA